MTGVFRTSTDLDQIAPALVAVFAVSRTVGTDASAKIDTKGGDGYRYDYATLSQVYGAVRASLADAGVVPMQTTVIDEAAGAVLLRCSTRLLHSSGQWIENDAVVSVDSRGRAQQWGAAMSYARAATRCSSPCRSPQAMTTRRRSRHPDRCNPSPR